MKLSNISLVPIDKVEVKYFLHILDVRNEESIRKWMYTDHLISIDEHLNWIESIKKSCEHKIFVVFNNDNILGIVSLNDIDYKNKKSNWAYYLTSAARGGVGAAIEYKFIDFVFTTMDIEKLNCEVIEGNNIVISLHEKFGFLSEGFRVENIIKKDVRVGVHYLGLTKKRWLNIKSNIYESYSSFFSKYNIKFYLD